VIGEVLAANVDAGVLGDVLYPDHAVSVQPVIAPLPRHLWRCHRRAALEARRRTWRPSPILRPTPVCRPRHARRTHRPAQARAPDDDGPPPAPVKHDARAAHPGAAFDQPEGLLRDRSMHA
jgi:hypothetical protein